MVVLLDKEYGGYDGGKHLRRKRLIQDAFISARLVVLMHPYTSLASLVVFTLCLELTVYAFTFYVLGFTLFLTIPS